MNCSETAHPGATLLYEIQQEACVVEKLHVTLSKLVVKRLNLVRCATYVGGQMEMNNANKLHFARIVEILSNIRNTNDSVLYVQG